MFRNYWKLTFRNIKKSLGNFLINVFGLAIGLACFLLIANFVLDELSYDKHFENAERIYRVGVEGRIASQDVNEAVTSSLMAETLLLEYPEVLAATRLTHTPNMLVRYGERTFNETNFLWVDSSFFDIFNAEFRHGDKNTALKDHHTVVMTVDAASRYFDDLSQAVGQIVNYEDGTPYRVSGIVENPPLNAHFHYGMLSPLSSWDWGWEPFWLNHFMHTYILLPENYPPENLEAKFPAFIQKYVRQHLERGLEMSMDEFQSTGGRLGYFLQLVTDIHLHSHLNRELEPNSDIKYVYIFSLIAFFILIIACINYMNLSTARSAGRAREVGIRKVLGSNRRQIIRQFIFESILLTFIAFLLAIGIAFLLKPAFIQIAGKPMVFHIFRHWQFLPVFLLLPVFIGFLAGSYPALFLASFQPVRVLKSGGSGSSRGRSGLRSALVVFQFAISIFLFISTIIVYRQLNYAQNKRLGFQKENVVVIKRGWAIGQNPDGSPRAASNNTTVIDAFKNALLQNPQILVVSGSSSLPGKDYYSGVYRPEGAPADEHHPANFFWADYDFADALNLEFVEGRFFRREMASDSTAIVINESAAKSLGIEPPYGGRRIGFPGNDHFFLHIVGVVKDFHYASLHHKIEPLVMGLRNLDRTYISVRLRPESISESIAHIEKIWLQFIPYKPFEFYFLDDDYENLYQAERRISRLFTMFSALAIFIACLGLFGLASYTTEQRRKEIGIRKVLGASILKIVINLSGEFTKWVLMANLIAWPLAWLFMNRWLRDFAYRVDLAIYVFLLAGLLALVIALLTVGLESLKAASRTPVKTLRYE